MLAACEVPEDFNAILSCIQEGIRLPHHEHAHTRPLPAKARVLLPRAAGLRAHEAAGAAFEGTHDFAAVRSVGTQTKTTVRTVHWCRAEKHGDEISVAVCADGFLYNMVRAIVGTMVYASHGKLEPEEIPALLETGDRRLTGPTMPPQGLYLNRVWYEGEVGRLMLS